MPTGTFSASKQRICNAILVSKLLAIKEAEHEKKLSAIKGESADINLVLKFVHTYSTHIKWSKTIEQDVKLEMLMPLWTETWTSL